MPAKTPPGDANQIQKAERRAVALHLRAYRSRKAGDMAAADHYIRTRNRELYQLNEMRIGNRMQSVKLADLIKKYSPKAPLKLPSMRERM